LRLSGQQTVGELLRRYRRFREGVRRRTHLIEHGGSTFEPTGLCRLAAKPSRGEIIALLQRSVTESGEGIGADFTLAVDPGFEEPLIVEGFGTAPHGGVSGKGLARGIDADRPAWADRLLTAKAAGKAPAEAGNDEARRELAVAAARIEATRQLWIEIEKLPLPDSATVASLLAEGRLGNEAVRAIDGAILPITAPVFGGEGSATVTLGIRLETVWRVLQERGL
jgi:hypothetical protein